MEQEEFNFQDVKRTDHTTILGINMKNINQYDVVEGHLASDVYCKNIGGTTIIDYSEQVDAMNEQAGFDFTIGVINRQMDEYGALYVFLKLNKKHQDDIENSFIALANGNR